MIRLSDGQVVTLVGLIVALGLIAVILAFILAQR
jgi:hypothetical protein